MNVTIYRYDYPSHEAGEAIHLYRVDISARPGVSVDTPFYTKKEAEAYARGVCDLADELGHPWSITEGVRGA